MSELIGIILITTGSIMLVISSLSILSKKRYTKKDLSDAWHHGAVRSPKEYQYLNNFDDYFSCKYKNKYK